MRLLLLHKSGSFGYDDLKTVDGIVYDTFVDACIALGLIDTDHEWINAMKEAKSWMMPNSLRNLFVRILIHCRPSSPESLWDEFKLDLSEDFIHQGKDIDSAIELAYMTICKLLLNEGSNINDFPSMPQVRTIYQISHDNLPDINSLQIGSDLYSSLKDEQMNFVNTILNLFKNPYEKLEKNCFYLDGPGGTGKTHVYKTLYHLLNGHSKSVCCMAFTGIAATLLPNGKTVHKILGLPLMNDSSSNIKLQSKEADLLRKTDVFIWDEAPMAPRYALEIMDKLLRDVTGNNVIMGGKIVILGGDFRQLLPVLKYGTRSEIVNLSIKNSLLWRHFDIFRLTTNMRIKSDELSFAKFVLDVGNGILNDGSDLALPENCIKNCVETDSNIVEKIFGHLIKDEKYDELKSSAILSARNTDVDEINRKVVSLLDESTEKIYTSIDSSENCNDNGIIN